MKRRALLLAGTILLVAGAPAPMTPKRIRGTITSLAGNTLTVTDRAGQAVKVELAPDYTVAAIVPATLSDVKTGSKIGIVGFGPPTKQRAAVVSIFPPGATVNEAQFAWDSQPDSVMTNAPVVSDVAASSGRTLTVTVKGQSIEVTVPDNAIIQTSEPGTAAMLTPGAKVLIFAQQGADGAITAPRVNVGKNGFTPAN